MDKNNPLCSDAALLAPTRRPPEAAGYSVNVASNLERRVRLVMMFCWPVSLVLSYRNVHKVGKFYSLVMLPLQFLHSMTKATREKEGLKRSKR